MAKTFTDKPIHQFDQVKTSNITTNLDKHLDEINGGLDSNNLPVDSVDKDSLKLPINSPLGTSGAINKYGTIMPSQAYYQVFTGAAADIYTPITKVNLDSDTWSAGFNTIPELDATYEAFPLSFDAREGMLIGCATIDWEHGNNVFNVDDGDGNFVARGRGNDIWTEWQVYVNNVAVARTGKIFPRRHTTQIPFAVPCGTQPVTVDCRVQLNTWRSVGSPTLETTSTDFKIFSASIWIRNQYR